MVEVLVDTACPRVTRPLMSVMVGPDQWDEITPGSDWYIDPLTQTALLRPYQLRSEWYTSATGNYARLGRADYRTQAGAALSANDWAENQVRLAGDIFLESLGVNTAVYTLVSHPRNRPFVLEFFIAEQKGLGDVALECGWGEVGASDTVSLRVYGSGQAEVWKGTALLGKYSVAAGLMETRTATETGAGKVLDRFLRLVLLPVPPRRLLVFSDDGGGFVHTFEDLPQDTLSTITAAGRFWWRVAQGKASVQCAPLTFPTSGYGYSIVQTFPEAPPVLSTFDGNIAASLPGYGTVPTIAASLVLPGGGAYTPDGSIRDVRLKVAITGDGTNTAYVGAADLGLLPGTALTNAEHVVDIADAVQRISIRVPEGLDGAQADIEIKRKASALSLAWLSTGVNRPLSVRVDDGASGPMSNLFVGLLDAVTDKQGPRENAAPDAYSRPIGWSAKDLTAQLLGAIYTLDAPALDGLFLHDAVGRLLQHAGIPVGEMDLEATTLLVPYNWTAPVEWNYQPKAGDNVAGWLRKLHEDLAPTWFMGFRPTQAGVKFVFRSETGLGTTPKADIWLHRDGQTNVLPCRSFEESFHPPEATRISVYGWDAGTKTFLLDSWSDTALEDPTLLPEDRPEGWWGQVAPLVLVEPRLTTPASVTAAKEQLVQRVGTSQYLAEWRCPLLLDSAAVPLWKGDVVRVRRQDGSVRGIYRILEFSGDLHREASGATFRDWSYKARRIEVGTGEPE